jgi:nucleotide-binding universal stress UspA family protein
MWKTILVGYDGSDYSKKALGKAEKIALQYDSKLIIVNVYRELVTKSFSLSLLEEAKKLLSNEVNVETISARNTDVDNELIEIANKHEADLIIVGSRGMSEVASLLLGSVSHEIANNSPVDVLIVRNNEI